MNSSEKLVVAFALLTWTLSCTTDSDRIPSGPQGIEGPAAPFQSMVPVVGVPYNTRPSERELDRLASELPGFGGMYSDVSGILHVYITTSSDQDKVAPAVSAFLARSNLPARPIVTERGQYTFQELRHWQPSIDALLAMPGVLSTDLDEASNRLRVGVINAVAVEEIRKAYISHGVPAAAVIVQTEEPVVSVSTLSDTHRPLRGGNETATLSQPCTMGFNAFDDQARRIFYTASHCSGSQGQMEGLSFYQPSPWVGSSFVGTEISDPSFWNCPTIPGRVCRFSDAAAVEFDDPADFSLGTIHKTTFRHQTQGSTTIDSQDPIFTIVEWTAYPIGSEVGDLVLNKMGKTTGWTNARLSAVCVNINVFFNGQPTNRTLLCQDKVDAGAQTGDSGSPVFRKIGNNQADLYGMLWGREGNSRFVFSSLWNISAEIPFQSVH
jgi:hypothetical protein